MKKRLLKWLGAASAETVQELVEITAKQRAEFATMRNDGDRLPLGGFDDTCFSRISSFESSRLSMFQQNSVSLRAVVLEILHYLKLEVKSEGYRLEKKENK